MSTILYANDSKHGHLEVVQDGKLRLLSGCGGIQGAYDFSSGIPVSPYIYEIGSFISNTVSRVLIVGGGAFLLPRILDCQDMKDITTIDHDARTIEVANNFFGYTEKKHHSFMWEDGISAMRGLKKACKEYDVVVFDAFTGFSHDEGVYGKDGVSLAHDILTKDGILITNMVDKDPMGRYLFAHYTAMSVFKTAVSSFMIKADNGMRNIVSKYEK